MKLSIPRFGGQKHRGFRETRSGAVEPPFPAPYLPETLTLTLPTVVVSMQTTTGPIVVGHVGLLHPHRHPYKLVSEAIGRTYFQSPI